MGSRRAAARRVAWRSGDARRRFDHDGRPSAGLPRRGSRLPCRGRLRADCPLLSPRTPAPTTSRSHPTRIVEVLERHHVEYVLVGGIAAQAHGAIRATYDLDCVPRSTIDNLQRPRHLRCPRLSQVVVRSRIGSQLCWPTPATLSPPGACSAAGPALPRSRSPTLEDARADLRHHDLATQLDSCSRRLPELDRTVAALDTWQRWASGKTVSVDQLPDHRRGPHRRPRHGARRAAPSTRPRPPHLG